MKKKKKKRRDGMIDDLVWCNQTKRETKVSKRSPHFQACRSCTLARLLNSSWWWRSNWRERVFLCQVKLHQTHGGSVLF